MMVAEGGGLRGALDVGSNSVKILVSSSSAELSTPVYDDVRICGLGRGLAASGCLEPAAMDRCVAALGELIEAAREHGVGEIAAVGTMALRSAANGAEFLARIAADYAVEIQVIPGEEEARLSYLAASSALGPGEGQRLLLDVGGGSSEFISGRDDELIGRFSLDMGCIRFSESHLAAEPPGRDAAQALLKDLAGELDPVRLPPRMKELVGIGGTATSLGTVKLGMESWEPALIQGLALSRDEIEAQLLRFAAATLEERAALPGLHPGRASVITAGTAIILAVMRRIGAENLILSDRALRHGLWLDRWG
jgi:exopolyphosphatase / guanosine-5'-triphosphate,3'-diphosphate pyrophosphatase